MPAPLDPAPAPVDPAVLATVEIRWMAGHDGLVTSADVPDGTADERRVLRSFLSILSWSELASLADAVATHRSYRTDFRGVGYPAATGWDGVVAISDAGGQGLVLTSGAFTTLFSHLVDTAVGGATDDGDDVVRESWWPKLLDDAARIRADAAAG